MPHETEQEVKQKLEALGSYLEGALEVRYSLLMKRTAPLVFNVIVLAIIVSSCRPFYTLGICGGYATRNDSMVNDTTLNPLYYNGTEQSRFKALLFSDKRLRGYYNSEQINQLTEEYFYKGINTFPPLGNDATDRFYFLNHIDVLKVDSLHCLVVQKLNRDLMEVDAYMSDGLKQIKYGTGFRVFLSDTSGQVLDIMYVKSDKYGSGRFSVYDWDFDTLPEIVFSIDYDVSFSPSRHHTVVYEIADSSLVQAFSYTDSYDDIQIMKGEDGNTQIYTLIKPKKRSIQIDRAPRQLTMFVRMSKARIDKHGELVYNHRKYKLSYARPDSSSVYILKQPSSFKEVGYLEYWDAKW